jgi:hypothetical protein
MIFGELTMPDDVENTAPSPPPSPVKKTRGRPRKIATESPQQRIERLQAELQQAHEAKKIADQHHAALVGAVVITHARTDEDFRRELAGVLRMAVTLRTEFQSKADRIALSDLARELESMPSASDSS